MSNEFIKVQSVQHLKELVREGHNEYTRAIRPGLHLSLFITESDDHKEVRVEYCFAGIVGTFTWENLETEQTYIGDRIAEGSLFADVIDSE